ncbi:COX15/CtaA family protein [Streptomyces albireticuli]|uniref:Cytochrome B n=1 Tax=Streptomyces albireticuli TaxID=1940 RepID=A0A2A2D3E2_9ACTN|nr:COX15/CtaA family protein [Streptomyces albireticuli]MCD9142288.1 COX15/CtaA family protein [Streptomyces albireticuli]MCD9162458.1 COX15/CtaA family protein [Streptomyces albireticuli]MCD9190462.1 COX15/CtaA family protein [Streptomyces albireticuli]PAU45850.1 cytochrome B [Streptomyces albireticuli]
MPNSMNPLQIVADRWQPSARFVRRAAFACVVMAVVIVVTGGAVRLTQSGLGCPTWPTCTEDSLTPTPEMGINGVIEFTNRMLTYVLCAVVGLAITAARAREPRRRSLTRLGWAQFWLVASNGIIGGITVLTGLNPYIVGSHFLAATALLTVAVVMWRRACEGDEEPRDLVARPVRQLSWVLVVSTALLIVIGTVVTGSGKHAGDAKKDVHRIPLDVREITQLHVDFVCVVLGLTVALWFVLRAVKAPAGPVRRVVEMLAVLLLQGAVGFVQYFNDSPELLVGTHMFGSCLVWIAVLRVFLSLRDRGELVAPASPADGAGELRPAAQAASSR